MKNYLHSFFIICLVLLIAGCSQNSKPKLHGPENCSIENSDRVFENNFYPFSETKYKTSDIIKYFKQGIKIDSGFNKNSNGDSILYYKYYDDSSQFIFSLNNYKRKNLDFDIALFKINSALIELGNGVKYAMPRKDFFNAVKYKEVNCDTFDIHDRHKGYYFRFIFENDTLKQMLLKYYIQ
jgi:hypothetical protein